MHQLKRHINPSDFFVCIHVCTDICKQMLGWLFSHSMQESGQGVMVF